MEALFESFRQGLRIHEIVEKAKDASNVDDEVKTKNIRILSKHIQKAMRFQRRMLKKKVRQVANIQRYSVQCVLVINLFNQYIFVLLWFWYLFLTAATLLSLLQWFVLMAFPCFSRWFVAQHMELSSVTGFDPFSKKSTREVSKFVHEYLHRDGVFVLRMVCAHAGVIFATDLIHSLWRTYYGIEAQILESPEAGNKALISLGTYDGIRKRKSEKSIEEHEAGDLKTNLVNKLKFLVENLKFDLKFEGNVDFTSTVDRNIFSVLLASEFLYMQVVSVDTKRESVKLKNATWKDLKAIFSLASPYKWRIMLGISFLGISSSIFLLTPRILGKLIDEFDDSKRASLDPNDKSLQLARYFKNNPLALIGVLFMGGLAIAARVYCMHTAGQLVINNLRKTVFNSVLRQDMAFFDKNKVGEIVSRLSTDALIVGYSVSMNLSDGARALVTCLGSSGLMVYTSPALCKVMFVVIPIIVGSFAIFGKLQRKYTMQMQEAVASANQVATERLSNIRTVRMLVAERKELAAYADKIEEIWRVSKKEGLAKGSMYGSFQFTGYIALSTILFYGSNLIHQGLLTYGELSSFCLYAVLSAASLSNMSGFFLELMKGLGASNRLFELKDRQPLIPLEGGIYKGTVNKEIRCGFSF
ncbi:hypothetical protein WR25_24438 isoform A [Diploscapter pachys]|uniref:Innexin n=1 Tax=Diploscapter pachys TaxID=2018661 RepID=A0A2A2LJ03_9BILA|nr:hypothetical protein WR25_24438 isoform A [Diploscapter pachys]